MSWTFQTAKAAMKAGALPDDFNEWGLSKSDGWTVAHEAAWSGHLPATFSQWGIANESGWAVAHAAAWNGHLPANFSQWDITNEEGYTVAHAAALNGHLPESLPAHIWRLTNNDGESVWDVAKERGLVTGDPPPLPMPSIKPGDFGAATPLF